MKTLLISFFFLLFCANIFAQDSIVNYRIDAGTYIGALGGLNTPVGVAIAFDNKFM